MPKPHDPRQDEALQIWLKSRGKATNSELAVQFGVPTRTVASWKHRGRWNAIRRKRGGAPFGNRNGVGHGAPLGNKNAVGHGAPKGNRNGVFTGEYERIDAPPPSSAAPLDLLRHELFVLTVRERRMMKRIKWVMETCDIWEGSCRRVVRLSCGHKTIRRVYTIPSTLDALQRLEDALTRVHRLKMRVILALHREERARLTPPISAAPLDAIDHAEDGRADAASA